jgi:general secretion pathway protein G
MADCRSRARERGFTLLELMIVAAILAVVASMGVPMYASALRTARIKKAVAELRTISQAIDSHRVLNGAVLPATLAQVGFGGRRDPWGHPYCYLNYQLGTGDGLEWAVDSGLLDPGAMLGDADEVVVKSDPGSGTASRKQQLADAITAVSVSVDSVQARHIAEDVGDAPVYAAVPVTSIQRRNRYMFPLNTDYDLFSLGPDAASAVALGHPFSLDDVIRANDGGYFGPAAGY